MNPIPFILLNFAGILTLWVYIYRLESKQNHLLNRKSPEFPDLRKPFIDLQERITSEAEETRSQSSSHAKNNQTAVKMLTGVVKKLPLADELAGVISTEATSVVEATQSNIQEDGQKTRDAIAAEHKKTRERIAQVKTRMADDEKDDQKDKAKVRRTKAAQKRIAEALDAGAKVNVTTDPSLPEGTMVLRDEETGDQVTITGVTVEGIKEVAKKTTQKKKRKTSK